MKDGNNFYSPKEIKDIYPDIVPVYQAAFAGEPWFEVSKCADASEIKRCIGGFSRLEGGKTCEMCGNCVTQNAYEQDELVSRFEDIAASRPTAWYLEQNDKGITLAAIAWKESGGVIAKEKYPDSPEMEKWLGSTFGDAKIGWLDEVFADKSKKPFGNLSNFGYMCRELGEQLQTPILAYRTINERMVNAAKRDFGDKSVVFKRQTMIPDRRDFIVINLEGTK